MAVAGRGVGFHLQVGSQYCARQGLDFFILDISLIESRLYQTNIQSK